MAGTRMARDTAWRSLQDLFRSLPPEATVEIAMDGPPPDRAALSVRIEFGEPAGGNALGSWDAPAEPGEAPADTGQPKKPVVKPDATGPGRSTTGKKTPKPPSAPAAEPPHRGTPPAEGQAGK